MEYDPIKDRLSAFFSKAPVLQILFYRLLDLLLLRAWHVHTALRAWARRTPAEVDILDAGSGLGQYTYYLSRLKPQARIRAIDVKAYEIAHCKRLFARLGKTNVRFETGDLTQLSEQERYDLILCVDVMEHVLEDTQVFQNFLRALKPGGMLIINTPSDQGGSEVQAEGDESFIGEHVRDGYNRDELVQRLRQLGFSQVEGLYTYGKPGRASWKLSMKYPMQMLNASFLGIVVLPVYYLFTYPLSYVLNWMDVQQRHARGTGLTVKAWK
jgi:2-polyprenyl-3-methyl-5-hydroxy-6-metoxy-1,4-benzoquinol methylase